MGYNFYIGEATVEPADEYGGCVRIGVVPVHAPESPHAANEQVNGHENRRWPSYTVWHDFARSVGLEAFFFDKEDGLIAEHPGAVYLLPEHAKTLTDALAKYRGEHPNALPGFTLEADPFTEPEAVANQERPPEGKYFDYTLARLEWCEWWVRWALANCNVPIFRNT